MQESKKVLAVGKTKKIGEWIQNALDKTDWEIESIVASGQYLGEIKKQSYDVAVLEIDSENSLSVLSELKNSVQYPVLGMFAEENKKILEKALNQGMDDFLLGDFNSFEFMMRIETLRKRCKCVNTDVCQMKSFSLDKVRRKVYLKSERVEEHIIELSHTEYMLLSMFVENENVLLTYKDLYKKVWDSDSLDDVRTVKVHVSNLRKKIDPCHIGIITNVRRAGYIFSNL